MNFTTKKLGKLCLYRNSINLCRNKSSSSTADYCLESLKKHDYDNFICTILLKNSARACAIAVRSFNVEVAKVAEQVSQQSIGIMRLKFWEETIDKCYSKNVKDVPKHPVAVELSKAINGAKISKRYFNNLITCRKQYLNINGFKTLEDLEKYAEQSVSNVYYLILEGCDVKNVHADHAASHLGKAQGIVQSLRSVPVAKRLNFLSLPQDILIKHKVSQEEILRGVKSENLTECIFEVASRAHQHLEKARCLNKDVPDNGKCALLPAECVFIYLDKLQKVNYDIFHPDLQQRSWKLLPTLWINNLRKHY